MTTVAIAGCGMISGAYAPTINEFDHLTLVACADAAPDRAAEFAEKHGVRAMTFDALLADPEIDIVANLTPASAHVPVTRAILEAGKSAFSEKPLGTDVADAQALVAMASSAGLRLGCAPDTFLGVGLQTARAAIDAGAIGEPIAATAFVMGPGPDLWHPNPEIFFERGAGPLYDMGPYYLTSLIQFLGAAVRVSAIGRNTHSKRVIRSKPRRGEVMDVDVPTHISTTIEFASGAIATLVASFDVAKTDLRWIEVYGTEGTVSVPDPNTFGGRVAVRRLRSRRRSFVKPRLSTLPQQRGLGLAEMAWAANSGRPHRASGDMALHVVDLMAGAVRSSEEHCVVDLTTTCERPPLLPDDLAPNTFDD